MFDVSGCFLTRGLGESAGASSVNSRGLINKVQIFVKIIIYFRLTIQRTTPFWDTATTMTQLTTDVDSSSTPTQSLEPGTQDPRPDLPPDLANLTDEQIATLTQEITDSYSKDVPLVGPFLPISVLVDEFKDNEPFRRKLNGLAEKWSGFRRTARNGNCFYQAFAYAWLHFLQQLGEERIKQEITKIRDTAKTLEDAGMSHCYYQLTK